MGRVGNWAALRRSAIGCVGFRARVATFAVVAVAAGIVLLGSQDQALADCLPAASAGLNPAPGTTVTCATNANNVNGNNGYGTGDQDGLTINVLSGVTVNGDDNGIFVRNNNIINNAGTISSPSIGIQASDSTPSNSVTLTVNNASTGTITGGQNAILVFNFDGTAIANVTNYGLISTSANNATTISADNLNVTNYATGIIQANNSGGFAIQAFGNGLITNYGLITADALGVSIGTGTIFNGSSGTISQTGTAVGGVFGGNAVFISGSGSLINYGTITGADTSSSFSSAVFVGSGSVFNAGTISSPVTGITIADGTIVNSGTGVITTGAADFGIGIATFGAGTVAITNSGSIIADGASGIGISVLAGGGTNTINNSGLIQANGDTGTGLDLEGTVTVVNSGAIVANGPSGVAVFICNCGNVTFTNSGLIQANGDNSGSGGNSGIGIWVRGGATASIVNTGTIQATDPLGTGIQADSGAILTVNNSGTITAGAFGINSADGAVIFNSGTITISAPSSSALNAVITVGSNGALPATPNIVNTGTLTAGDDASGIVAGLNNFILNTGSIVTGNSTGIFRQAGIMAADGSTVVNGGSITVGNGSGLGVLAPDMSGMLAIGDNVILQNAGMITTGVNAAGIATLGNNTQITNSGIIFANGSTGVLVQSPIPGVVQTTGAVITNNGVIIANTTAGIGGIGVNFNDNSGTLTNNGLIQSLGAGSVAINSCSGACGGTVTITNNGTIDGRVVLDVGASITNNGLMTFSASDGEVTVGQVHITGDAFVQTSGGTLALRVTSDVRSDALATNATGTLTLAGTLKALVQPGLYANTTTYTNVVTNSGLTTTTFDRFVSSSPFFTATPIYDTTDPTSWSALNLQLDRIAFGAVPGLTPNQRAVGNYLESHYSTGLTGNAATFYSNLLAVTTVNVLNNLSGEGISGAQNAGFATGSQFNGAMQTQGMFAPDLGGLNVVIPAPQYAATRVAAGHEAFASLDKSAAATAPQPGRFRIWTAGFGATQSLHGEADPGSFSQSVRSAGGMLGVDWQTAWDLRIGFAAGGSETTFSAPDLQTTGRMTSGHVGAYAMKTWGAWYAAATLSYARFDNSTTRTIVGIGPTETASGSFASDQLAARLELGWKQAYGRVNVTPFVAVEPAVLWQRGFTETGANVLGLTVASHTSTSLPTFLGVQVDGRILTPEGLVFAPYSRVSWVHEFEPDRRVSASLITLPGSTFTVAGARAAGDAGRLDFGGKLYLPGGPALFANFAGEWSDRTETYSATGGFRAAW